ncbi:hypothetical protein F5984_06210 [Rudanella paleaurantiibacter]|uniref:Uncharacterized protein n=1 Tax=Rudanella paleaurantiibacter TaxID=2614655 RepID=A0A7J5U217_9BACT|nr:hypothetical protein [Rudanella paleaurantiibacter]KAB7731817.1 hypothetical protein F5984_06210 [Rudanella paleaurantiibacter]
MIQRIFSSDEFFKTEKDLVQVLKLNCSAICDWCISKTETYISEEVDLGFGVADLVISRIDTTNINRIILNSTDIALYYAIKDSEGLSFDVLQNAMQISKSNLQKSVTKLIGNDIVYEVGDIFYLKKDYNQITKKSIAIEAKLKNWRRALVQAYRYRWFASESYVVMDRLHINAAIKSISEFEKFNIGLAEIDTCGRVITHFRPYEERPINHKMAMLLNEKIKEHLLSSEV